MSWIGKTVLLLEDEPIIAMGLEDMMLDLGAEVVLVGTVVDALETIEKLRPTARCSMSICTARKAIRWPPA